MLHHRRLRAGLVATALGLPLLVLAAPPSAAVPEDPPPETASAEGPPRLVLFLVIDQGGARELDRLRPLFRGGLARLYDEGVRFTAARHAHAVTETAPGHATLATGRHPRSHGIVGNDWYERESGEEVYATDDPEGGDSPANLRGPTLGDWLDAADPEAKVVAVSAKDRAAIMLGGHRADAAYWYDDDSGRFTTDEDHYGAQAAASPALERFHAREPARRWLGTPWEPLPEVAAAAGELEAESVDLGAMNPQLSFPHTLGGASPAPGGSYWGALYRSPFVDVLTAELAIELLEAEELGADAATDLLAVSFSGTDTVGHRYGPQSLELADTLVRLDRTVGGLLAAVEERVGLEHTLVMLSADHGVLGPPELLARRGVDARRVGRDEILCIQGLETALDERFGDGDWLLPGPFLCDEELARTAWERDLEPADARRAVEEAAREVLEACPGVERVWTRSELAAPPFPEEPGAAAWIHTFDPERSPDLSIEFEEGVLPTPLPYVASHGSPHPYDTDVPWIVRLPGEPAPKTVDAPVETVDVAPTAAALAGVPVPEEVEVDGVDRSALVLRGDGR